VTTFPDLAHCQSEWTCENHWSRTFYRSDASGAFRITYCIT